jgi:putative tryptophan/tyrosine transport system substrate-binding protein
MRRRDFIKIVVGSAAPWPLVAHAQQSDGMRRIGVLSGLLADDPDAQVQFAVLWQELRQLGWVVGRNLQIEYRWGAGDTERIRKGAAELAAVAPDVIFATSGTVMPALQQATRAVPVVFVGVIDPVGAGFVASLSRPGGNATGFTLFEYSMSGKWLELLKQIAPGLTRAAVLRDPGVPSGIGQFGAVRLAAPAFGLELSPIDVHDASEIERGIAAFARAKSGIIVTASVFNNVHRNLIIALAARHRLPAIYSARAYAAAGGLISYGPDRIDPYRRVASYIDRVLKGEKPADLPVQEPTKFELVINLKTAKTLGLDVPQTLLARADEVIQ